MLRIIITTEVPFFLLKEKVKLNKYLQPCIPLVCLFVCLSLSLATWCRLFLLDSSLQSSTNGVLFVVGVGGPI